MLRYCCSFSIAPIQNGKIINSDASSKAYTHIDHTNSSQEVAKEPGSTCIIRAFELEKRKGEKMKQKPAEKCIQT